MRTTALRLANAQRREREIPFRQHHGGCEELLPHGILEVPEEVRLVGEMPFQSGFDGLQDVVRDATCVAAAGSTGEAGHFQGDRADCFGPWR